MIYKKKEKDKEKNRNKIFFLISKKCFDKIKETSENNQLYCFYNIPEYIPGFPLFNMTDCVLYLLNILKEKGFICRYVDNYILYITWNVPNKKYKAIEENKNNSIDNLKLKYKPLENNSFKNFIPRKKF